MKTKIINRLSLGLALAILPLVGACNQQTGDNPQSLVTAAQAEPIVQSEASDTVMTEAQPTETAVTSSAKPEIPEAVGIPSEKPLLPTINPSSALAEVIKLAQAGVDESVMYAYVTNSTSIFGLGSDEIIYLNDLGVNGPLINTMIEHDQEVKRYWTNKAQAQLAAATATNTTAAPENASGPTYINPPPPEPAPQPQVVEVSNNYFYDTLSPYGSWVNVNGYGRCWRPTVAVVNPGWQPYADRGRWVYSDAGWYWLSDYSWGATTFHYGRWFNQPNVGWCWWPDTVWAPSWVSWRYSSGYCGWAPLPPTACYRPGVGFTYYGNSVGVSFSFGLSANCYTFVPTAYFCSPRPCNYRVPAHHANGFYNQTIVANNYIAGKNNTVINNGIPVEQVAATTQTQIRPVPIREAGGDTRPGARGERLEQSGRALTVHRPNWPRTQQSVATPTTAGSSAVAAQTVQASRHNNPGTTWNTPRSSQRDQVGFAGRRGQWGGIASSAAVADATPEVTVTPATQSPSVAQPDSRPSHNNGLTDPSRPRPGRNSGAPLIIHGNNLATPPSTSVTPPTTASAPASSIVVVGRRDDNPAPARSLHGRSSSRDRVRESADFSRSTGGNPVQPVAAAPSASPAPTAVRPTSSVVVIGNGEGTASPSRNPFASTPSRERFNRQITPTGSLPATSAASQNPTSLPPAPAANGTSPAQFVASPAAFQRRQSQRATRGSENRAMPTATYTAPASAQRQSAPVTPSFTAPAVPSAAAAQANSANPSRGFGGPRFSNDPRRDR